MPESPAQTLFAEMVAGADARAIALRDAMNAYGAAVREQKTAHAQEKKARIAHLNASATAAKKIDAVKFAQAALDKALADIL